VNRANDLHVVPADQEHESDPSCWCGPITETEDVATGARVWLHRRSHDHGHHYTDEEG
jgi:hypothetical protein